MCASETQTALTTAGRAFSGKVFSHPALASYDYFWRLDSRVRFFCASYDPVAFMHAKHAMCASEPI